MSDIIIYKDGGDYVLDPYPADNPDGNVAARLPEDSPLGEIIDGRSTIGLNGRGDAVKAIQEKLGWATPDGWWSQAWFDWLKDWQSNRSLPATGIVDSATLVALIREEAQETDPLYRAGVSLERPGDPAQAKAFDQELDRLGVSPGTTCLRVNDAKLLGIALPSLRDAATAPRADGTRADYVIDSVAQLKDLVSDPLAAVSSGAASPLLYGSSGPAAKFAQARLAELGYGTGLPAPDGFWGGGSVAAMRQFQADHGLKPSGNVDPDTARALSGARKGDALPAPTSMSVVRPHGALEADYFDHEMERLGLGKALKDGVITEDEARAAGIAMSALRLTAARGGDQSAITSYEELLDLASVAPLPKDKFFAPGQAADYVIFAPKEFQVALGPLLDHRALQGHKVALVDPGDVYSYYGQGGPDALARFVKDAHDKWGEPKLRYLLLAGGANDQSTGSVPTFNEDLAKLDPKNTRFGSESFDSDLPYALPDEHGIPQVAVGRLPVATGEELEQTVSKIIRYEAVQSPALWQTRTTLSDGAAGFGDLADKSIAYYTKQAEKTIPEQYDVTRATDQPSLTTGGDDVSDAFSRGALLVNYVGHMDFPVSQAAVAKTKEGNPIVALTCCFGADYAAGGHEGSGLTSDHGAIALVGATAISMPYTNAAWAQIFGEEILKGGDQTLGDAFDRAKARFANGEVSANARLVSGAPQLFVGGGLSHLYMYNLYGDPATLVRRPYQIQGVSVLPRLDPRNPSPIQPGKPFSLAFDLPPGAQNGVAYVTVERPLGSVVTEDPSEKGISDDERNARMARNAQLYNERAAATIAVRVVNGKLAGPLTLPPNTPSGYYNVRVAVVGSEETAVGVSTHVAVGIHTDPLDTMDRSESAGFDDI